MSIRNRKSRFFAQSVSLVILSWLLVTMILPALADTGGQNSFPWSGPSSAGMSINACSVAFCGKYPNMKPLLPESLGGKDKRDDNNQAVPTMCNPTDYPGCGAIGTWYPKTMAADMKFMTDSGPTAAMCGLMISGGTDGHRMSDLKEATQKALEGEIQTRNQQFPGAVAQASKAHQLAQGTGAGNAMGEAAKGQAASAINYVSMYLQNFTAVDGNRWQQIHDNIFVPIAILLLLPGAVLTQIKAIMSAANPTLGEMNPFEGMLKAMVALFLIPSSSLILSYGIDFSNSITYSIAN